MTSFVYRQMLFSCHWRYFFPFLFCWGTSKPGNTFHTRLVLQVHATPLSISQNWTLIYIYQKIYGQLNVYRHLVNHISFVEALLNLAIQCSFHTRLALIANACNSFLNIGHWDRFWWHCMVHCSQSICIVKMIYMLQQTNTTFCSDDIAR